MAKPTDEQKLAKLKKEMKKLSRQLAKLTKEIEKQSANK